MPEPTIRIFTLPNKAELAVIVMDEDEFFALCDELRNVFFIDPHGEESGRAADTQIASLKAARTIPMISRGTKTEFLFERFEITQDKLSVIIRGHGQEIAKKMLRDLSERN
jgi:hypothetical protein